MDATIVGIGASAGGLEAVTELLEATPNDTGFAFVIVQHMAPTTPSMLVDLLTRHTDMPVRSIKNGEIPSLNTVYVIPPGSYVTMYGSSLALHDTPDDQHLLSPIDMFFKSLAENKGEKAYALVLSGTGSDGTLGIGAIKSAGGVTIAQQGDSAKFSGAPDSAIATGLIDFSLRPNKIPAKLIKLESFRKTVALRNSKNIILEIEARLPEIIASLGDQNSSSFRHYKPETLVRRTLRRMTLQRITDVDTYIEKLKSAGNEREDLVRDFLIGVTQFFRNPEMFQVLEQEVLIPLLKRDQKEFRVWCPGCSSGEEVYSLAIIIHELKEKLRDQRPWKLFGTDIDKEALTTARKATYDKASIKQLKRYQVNSYLKTKGKLYNFKNCIRNNCVFVPHNLLTDPPFSRIDLISCRNLMIYIDQPTQAEVFSSFHYALNPNGFLWLGPSETLPGDQRLFDTVNHTARIFKREEVMKSIVRPFSHSNFSPSSQKVSVDLQEKNKPTKSRVNSDVEIETEQAYLSYSAPPFARINQHDEVIYTSEKMRSFLRPAKGVPSSLVDDYFIEGLRMPLRLILKTVRESTAPEEILDIVIDINGEDQIYDLLARPLDPAAHSILVSLLPVRLRDESLPPTSPIPNSQKEKENELSMARKRMAARERDYELAEQELRAKNEELLTMNEELQSSNEELETSREELQSINEELETINRELTANYRDLSVANSNLKNLLENTDIATFFTNLESKLRLFTPRVRELFSVQDRDIGRSIYDLVTELDYPDLSEDLDATSKQLKTISREVVTKDKAKVFIAKLKPYQDVDGRIDGAVVSFIDITNQRNQQKNLEVTTLQLKRRVSELEAFYDCAPIGVGLHGADFRYLRVNKALSKTIGLPAENIVGHHPVDIVPDIWKIVEPIFEEILSTHQPILNIEVTAPTLARDEKVRTWIANYFPILGESRKIFGIGVTALEVTDIKQLQNTLEQQKRDLADASMRFFENFELAPIGIFVHVGWNHVIQNVNHKGREILGIEDPTGQTWDEFYPDLYKVMKPMFDDVLELQEQQTKRLTFNEAKHLCGNDLPATFQVMAQPYEVASSSSSGVLCMALDVSEIVAQKELIKDQTDKLRKIFDTMKTQVFLLDNDLTVLSNNQIFFNWMKRPPKDIVGEKFLDVVKDFISTEALVRLQEMMTGNRNGYAKDYQEVLSLNNVPFNRRVMISIDPIFSTRHGLNSVDTIVVTFTDQTPLIEANERKDILLAELEHRVKNVFATITAVVEFTASNSVDVAQMNKSLTQRLSALSRTHGRLTASGFKGQSLSQLLQLELSVCSEMLRERVFLRGDDPVFSSNDAVLISLAIHELLINSLRYGALSSAEGHIKINVEAQSGKIERLTWREIFDNTVDKSSSDGFGTLLLTEILPGQLSGVGSLDFSSHGLVYNFSCQH